MSLRVTNDNSPPPDPHSVVKFGHIGAGTPHARMERLWLMMHEYEDLMVRYANYSPVSSKGLFEDSFMHVFEFLLECALKEGYVRRSTMLDAIREQQAAWKGHDQ